MNHIYLIEYLDLLVSQTLNPRISNVSEITDEESEAIISCLQLNKSTFQSRLVNQVFALTGHKQIELLVGQYHAALILLLDQSLENQQDSIHQKANLKKLSPFVIDCIEELLLFIEVRFAQHFNLSQRIPATQLSTTKAQIGQRLQSLENKITLYEEDKATAAILFQRLYFFIQYTKHDRLITFKNLHYAKDLLDGLERLNENCVKITDYSPLDQLLIYLNFNSKAYLNYLTQRLAANVNNYKNTHDKMDLLLLYYKTFNQLHRKPEVSLNSNYSDIHTVLTNWFTQEIFYLEKKQHLAVVPLGSPKKETDCPDREKILVDLTTDQIALVLRAADEIRLFQAKSMNQVFRSIVPFLSTPHKKDLSYDSVRSKSYVAEDRDKQITIRLLERIIKKIASYGSSP